jgi:hypothetical protein
MLMRKATHQYAYVYVYVPDKTALGLSAEAIVTVQKSIMRCSKCHGGRRIDDPSAVKGKACPHINELNSNINAPGREAISEVFYGGEKRSKKKRSNPIFQGDALNFRSESGSIETEWRSIGYDYPQMEPLVISGKTGPRTSRMGGLDDPDFIRMKTLLHWQFESRFFEEHSMQRDPQGAFAKRERRNRGKVLNFLITTFGGQVNKSS